MFICQHLQGFFVTIWIAAVTFKSNDILWKQTALEEERKISVLIDISLGFTLHVIAVYWWYWNDDVLYPLVMLPPKSIPPLWHASTDPRRCGTMDEEVEVDHLLLCTVVEDETLRLCEAPSKVDDMQLHNATDGIDASQFCYANNEVDNANTLHVISDSDLQTAKTAKKVITPSHELPDATNNANDSEIHNATNKPHTPSASKTRTNSHPHAKPQQMQPSCSSKGTAMSSTC